MMPDEIWAKPETRVDGGMYWTHSRGPTTSYTRTDLYTALQQENERLREALKYYSDYETYVSIFGGGTLMSEIHRDNGAKARAALEGERCSHE